MLHVSRFTIFTCVCFCMLSIGDWLTRHFSEGVALFYAVAIGAFVTYMFYLFAEK